VHSFVIHFLFHTNFRSEDAKLNKMRHYTTAIYSCELGARELSKHALNIPTI